MARGDIEDLATLEMALVGYQIEKEKIESKVREIQSQLKGKPVVKPAEKAPGVKRALSAAARRRISSAQKKRWAEHHKRMAQAAKRG
jgi:hypothetical protein